MENATRLLGWGLSLLGTLAQLGIVVAAIPQWRACILCGRAGPPIARPEIVDTWRPFIENPGAQWASGQRRPHCPEPRGAGEAYDLPAAPLPDGYDPHAYGPRRVYACVLVDGDGDVLAARMLRGTGRPGLDGRLIATIRRSWRFRAAYPASEPRSWQRVRLNSGPVEGSVRESLLLY